MIQTLEVYIPPRTSTSPSYTSHPPTSLLFFPSLPVHTPLTILRHEDLDIIGRVGEEEGPDCEVVYGRGMALEAGH